VKECDLLIVVGTMLETNLPNRLVMQALEAEKFIVEINPSPIITRGKNTYSLIMKATDALPPLS